MMIILDEEEGEGVEGVDVDILWCRIGGWL